MFRDGTSRDDFIDAGVDMAMQGVRMIESTLPVESTPAMARKFVDIVVRDSVEQAERFRLEGVPPEWILEFQRAYLRTGRDLFIALERLTVR